MTTDNTQELDDILDAFASGEVSPHWKDNRKTYTKPEAKQALLDWHNKQVEEVLDRLEGQSRRADDCTDDTLVVKMVRVEAERNKLKENTNE